jgi:acyl-homoserine-lactone acylase
MTKVQMRAIAVTVFCANAFVQSAQPRYQAHIRRTSYGIPHIQAKDFGGLGFATCAASPIRW